MQIWHDLSPVKHTSFHNGTNKHHNASLHAASSIAFVGPCALLVNDLCIVTACDLTDKMEKTVNESIHLLAQVYQVGISRLLFHCTDKALAI